MSPAALRREAPVAPPRADAHSTSSVRATDGRIPGIGGRGDTPRGRTPARGKDDRRGPAKSSPDPEQEPRDPGEPAPADADEAHHIDVHVSAALRAAARDSRPHCSAR